MRLLFIGAFGPLRPLDSMRLLFIGAFGPLRPLELKDRGQWLKA